jgi:hypothetical protein
MRVYPFEEIRLFKRLDTGLQGSTIVSQDNNLKTFMVARLTQQGQQILHLAWLVLETIT